MSTGKDTTDEDEGLIPTEAQRTGHVAVVYFHGMGSQRRYEETSRLIDSIDVFLSNAFRQRGERLGILTDIKPRLEPDRSRPDQTVTYVRTRHVVPDGSNDWDKLEVRFYEAYWAPIMAGTSSPWRVATWILRQGLRPWQTLRTVWRERQRLRRAALADLKDHRARWPEGTTDRDFDKLVRAYSKFDGYSAKRRFPEGRFPDFTRYIGETHSGSPETVARLARLAEAWLRHYRNGELRNAFLISTILLALILTGGLLVWSTLQLLLLLSGLSFISDDNFVFSAVLRDWLSPEVSTAAGLVASLLLAVGMRRFLVDYMGDVEAWATYEETEEKHQRRKRIIQLGTALLSHVLADPDCDRVVVVSHSLGTSIAHDTLLELARHNRAVNAADPISGPVQLEKIRHFVTLGSPIDKINYFFESYRSAYHRYTRVVETLRGDIADVPFAKNRRPHIHWVNFWDEADLISGSLHSPNGRKSLRWGVDNVHVSSLYFPAPGRAHAAYFGNREVIRPIFEMAYLDGHSFTNVPLIPRQGYDFASALLGPGQRRRNAKLYVASAVCLPWLGLFYLLLRLIGTDVAAAFVLHLLLVLGAALAIAWLGNAFRENRFPIRVGAARAKLKISARG